MEADYIIVDDPWDGREVAPLSKRQHKEFDAWWEGLAREDATRYNQRYGVPRMQPVLEQLAAVREALHESQETQENRGKTAENA